MSITLASKETDGVVNTIATNDPEIIKRTLEEPGEGLYIRSFQAVVSCDFPDNKGIAVADVLKLIEERTKRGELFHLVHTRFGCYQFGGPSSSWPARYKWVQMWCSTPLNLHRVAITEANRWKS